MATSTLPPTVPSLHIIAEHVLGAGLHAATGRIGLQVVPGGFGTPDHAADTLGGVWSVTDGQLRVSGADGSARTSPITTVRAAGTFFGVTPGMPESVYAATTPLDLDRPLPIDETVARRVAEWLELGGRALTILAERHADASPSQQTLWPEHFDLGLEMAEVNYGVSPGDEPHPEPYLYVGPWTPRPGPFWNEPFGASLPADAVGSVGDAVAFFEQGRVLAAGGAPSDPGRSR
jgi:hypothetical protein